MKKIVLVLFTFLFTSCNNPIIVSAKIEEVNTKPWPRSGNILLYTITYKVNNKIDTSTFIGNRLYDLQTGTRIYLSPGDSITVRKRGNKKIKAKDVISYVKYGKDKKTESIKLGEPAKSINYLDTIPLLPNSLSIKENQEILSRFFFQELGNNNIKIYDSIVVYIRIDTVGKTHIEKIYSDNASILNIIEKSAYKLPLFTPGITNNQKVDVITSFEIKPY